MIEERIQILNKFASGIVDMQISRNPLSSEVTIIFNDVVFDQYQDSIVSETERVLKRVMVTKNPDMSYVQELDETFLIDDKIPWLVSMTITGLSRIPKMNDNIIIEGVKYTISKVKPVNRNIDSLIIATVYPERADTEDVFIIRDIKITLDGKVVTVEEAWGKTVIISLVCGGTPKEYSFDGVMWNPFTPKIKVTLDSRILYNGALPIDEIDGGDSQEPSDEIDGGDSQEPSDEIDGGYAYSFIKLFIKDEFDNIIHVDL